MSDERQKIADRLAEYRKAPDEVAGVEMHDETNYLLALVVESLLHVADQLEALREHRPERRPEHHRAAAPRLPDHTPVSHGAAADEWGPA